MAHGFGDELPSWFDHANISPMGEKAKAGRWWRLTGQNGVCGLVADPSSRYAAESALIVT